MAHVEPCPGDPDAFGPGRVGLTGGVGPETGAVGAVLACVGDAEQGVAGEDLGLCGVAAFRCCVIVG